MSDVELVGAAAHTTAREVGFGTVTERGVRAAGDLPPPIVPIGVSLGVMPAQQLAHTRRGAIGAAPG